MNETATHTLFFCEIPRVTWRILDLLIRVDQLPNNLEEIIIYLTEDLEERYVAKFCNMLWILWKARNEEVFTGKKPDPRGLLAHARMLEIDRTKSEEGKKKWASNGTDI